MTDPGPLAVTAVGLATAVGSSALASVAALRAGVTRFAEVPEVRQLDRDGGRAEAVVAARAPLYRAARPPAETGAALLAAARADAERWGAGAAWDAEASAWLGPTLPEGADRLRPESPALARVGLLDPLATLASRRDAPVPPTGLAVVDSLTVPRALAHLAGQGRLKGSAAPSGLVPGEAAAAVAVESEATARAAGRTVLAVVESWGRGQEPVPLGGATPSPASGLADALAQATAGLPEAPDLCVLDLNGERARALEWALASSRALPRWQGALRLWTPADGAGDCGEATGGLLVVCAALALARGDARRALVAASDDAGARVALVLRAADRVDARGRPPAPSASPAWYSRGDAVS